MDTLQLLRDALEARAGIAPGLVQPEATLESLGIDSLTLLDLMFEMEQKLGIKLDEGQSAPRTVGELVGQLEALRSGTR